MASHGPPTSIPDAATCTARGGAAADACLDTRYDGQKIAQREIASALQNALDARRQRIIISQSTVNGVTCGSNGRAPVFCKAVGLMGSPTSSQES